MNRLQSHIAVGSSMVRAFCLSLALTIVPVAAHAGLTAPNGNPSGASKAGPATNGGYTLLNVDPANYRTAGNCPWLLPALNAQGFNAANGWTINFFALTGNIELDTYLAWVDTAPAFTQGKYSDPATPYPGEGGAELGLGYKPQGGDPTGAGVHWIQVIRTNAPSAFGGGNGVNPPGDPGYTYYLDDGWTGQTIPPSNPFYDGGYDADSTDFSDTPYRDLLSGDNWQAQVFIATEPVNKTLDIYDGVWWGFSNPTPEPGTLLLFGSGFVGLSTFLRKRRHQAD